MSARDCRGRRLRTRPQRTELAAPCLRRGAPITNQPEFANRRHSALAQQTPGRRACRYNIALALDRSDAQKLPPRTLCALVRCARGNDCRHGRALAADRHAAETAPPCLPARPPARPPVVRALCGPPMCRSEGPGCRAGTAARLCSRDHSADTALRAHHWFGKAAALGHAAAQLQAALARAAQAVPHGVAECCTAHAPSSAVPRCTHSLAFTAPVQPPLLSRLSGRSAAAMELRPAARPSVVPRASGIRALPRSWACNTCT